MYIRKICQSLKENRQPAEFTILTPQQKNLHLRQHTKSKKRLPWQNTRQEAANHQQLNAALMGVAYQKGQAAQQAETLNAAINYNAALHSSTNCKRLQAARL